MKMLHRILEWFFPSFGGGGGGGASKFKAVGTPPGFDYQSAAGLNQLAIGGDIASYAMSDKDFANRYPGLQDAYNNYQAALGQQTKDVAAGSAGQQGLMQGLAGQTANRFANPNSPAASAIYGLGSQQAGMAQPITALGASQAGLAQPLIGMGMQQAGLANPLLGMAGQLNQLGGQQAGIGGQINRTGQNITGMANTPYQLGQQLLQEPIDPQTQQQMMKAGLGSAAGSLGAASLGQGMAGQAAAARQLGLNTLQYGQAMRGEAMGDIGQAASIAGQGGQIQGLGAQTIAGGGQTIGLGGQMTGLAGQQIGQGAQTIGLGGQQLNQAGQLYGLAGQTLGQGAQTYGLGAQTQEQYQTDTANMASTYANMQNQQAMNNMMNMQTAGQLFTKRPFGLGGTNLAQTELGQAGAYNSFQQANYATMNGIAFNSAQLNAQNQQMQAQQSSAMTGAAISAGSSAAVAAATTAGIASAAACWVAREVFGTNTRKWQIFRHWLMNKAPRTLRSLYLMYGPSLALKVRQNRLLGALTRQLMNQVIARTTYVCLNPA